jgi:hypothetical protein
MKSLLKLHTSALRNVGLICDTDTTRDELLLSRRWEHEGDSFLTITLPKFAKALERGLANGRWPKTTVSSFEHHGGLPAFMRGFLLHVFNSDGVILDDPDTDCIWAVRQVCYLTHKVARPTTPEREERALAKFIETDDELGDHFDRHVEEIPWEPFLRTAWSVFGDMFDHLEKVIAHFDLRPSHGPGAVAEKLLHPERWKFDYWPERLEAVFPRWRYSGNTETRFTHDYVAPDAEIPVRVVCVPKTQATPRIIAIEPSTMQYAQQGLKREIYSFVGTSSLNNLLGFADQERNQRLACEASVRGDLATLDLSEASDRVHALVVERLLSRWPHLADHVFACRSMWAQVGSHPEVLLNKFASMGSALTFPIEAIVFATITLMSMAECGYSIRPSLWGRVVSIYGDDIIVPTDVVSAVVRNLEAFGFKVNQDKSFWTGKFRESCGREYYNGTDVSVVRLRADLPRSRQDAVLINRFVDFRNRCFQAGLWGVVKLSDALLENVIHIYPGYVPGWAQPPFTGMLYRETALRTKWRARWVNELQHWREHHVAVLPRKRPYEVSGDGGLFKWFLEAPERDPMDLLENQERPDAFHINVRGIVVSS